ncbi:MAG: SMP-30/gluconolactonase/LRE family protein [Ruminococcaceae bacterium]|nr:SMP-30/gluconolactonase/LRE family protein [Oscillospiraceae bacterium]
MKVELLTDARCIVGEGPIWDDVTGCLLMVDIQGKRMRRIHWDSGRIEETVLPQQTGFLVLCEDGGILGGAEDGMYRIAPDGSFEKKISRPFTMEGQRFNDGKVGPDGNLYLGTFSRDFTAAFYRMDPDGTITKLLSGVGNSNGLDWSADGKTLYYNDTPTGRTDAFDIADGCLSNRRTVCTYEGGNPDGMCIDADGNLWTAVWGSGNVVCVEPAAGRVLEKIELPVSQPACCTFAGEDMATLVITTAAHGRMLRDEPLAGSVFAVHPGVKGVRPKRIKLEDNT